MAPGVEFSDLNWIAIGLAVVSNILIGFLWYAAKVPTGKIWVRERGIAPDFKPTSKQMTLAVILMVVGAVFLMFVFMHTFVAYRDAYRLDGERTGDDGVTFGDAAIGSFFTWLGFFVPVQFGLVAWEGKSWKLFWVNAGYYLVALLVAGQIFAAFI